MTDDLTCDDFLGGLVSVEPPRKGYRAGVDPVLLAASIDARPGQAVLELGCGVGVASLCLAARVPDLAMTGVEVQETYAALGRANAARNDAPLRFITADLRKLPDAIKQQRFDHVIMNPPYFDRSAGNASADGGRDVAMGGDTPLADWLDVGARRVGPKGYLTIIQRMERLPEVIGALQGRLGAMVLLPIAGRAAKPPELFILRARQEGRAPFRMAPPLIMHEGATHTGDAESYRPQVRDILRNAAALAFGV